MTTHDKQQIDDLFRQLQQMAGESLPRDPQAEAFIRDHIQRQPAAPYYMTQLLLLQKQSLATARQQIDDLNLRLTQPGREQVDRDDDLFSTGSSFLAGAAQAALAIGGGLILADFVTDTVDALFGAEADAAYAEADLAADDESWI